MRGHPNIECNDGRSESVGIPKLLLSILERLQCEIHMLKKYPAVLVQANRLALPLKQFGP
ncbi:hypothetical protein D3C76_1363860 [compost metagenome]